jgi:nucleoside-diphosphate-sugar epimerase
MIFVTGASGLVGAHLITSLIEKGLSVRALYRKDIPVFKHSEKVHWVKGDILDIHSLEEALQGITQVYHCAAIVAFTPKQVDFISKGTKNYHFSKQYKMFVSQLQVK